MLQPPTSPKITLESMQPYGSSRSGNAMLTRRAASVMAESQPLYASKAEDGKSVVNLVSCAKCGKAVEAGKEVKKGWISKKPYHAECAPK